MNVGDDACFIIRYDSKFATKKNRHFKQMITTKHPRPVEATEKVPLIVKKGTISQEIEEIAPFFYIIN